MDFEDLRYKYCAQYFENTDLVATGLEKKAQIFFSVLALILGAMFFRLDYLQSIINVCTSAALPLAVRIALTVLCILLFSSLCISAFSLVACLKVRRYKSGVPEEFTLQLFTSGSSLIGNDDTKTFLKEAAMYYAIAAEYNAEINMQKARWIKICAMGLLAGVVLLFLVILMLTVLGFSK